MTENQYLDIKSIRIVQGKTANWSGLVKVKKWTRYAINTELPKREEI